jgi:hypothetical protein
MHHCMPQALGMGHGGCVRIMYICCYTDWGYVVLTSFFVVFNGVWMSGTIVHIQCLTDLLCMAFWESLTGFGLRSGDRCASRWCRQAVWVLQRLCILALLVQGKCGHWDATQKSSGNGKDLIQIHVSTTWVGRDHTPVRRYYTCAVTQIGSQDR